MHLLTECKFLFLSFIFFFWVVVVVASSSRWAQGRITLLSLTQHKKIPQFHFQGCTQWWDIIEGLMDIGRDAKEQKKSNTFLFSYFFCFVLFSSVTQDTRWTRVIDRLTAVIHVGFHSPSIALEASALQDLKFHPPVLSREKQKQNNIKEKCRTLPYVDNKEIKDE